MRICVVSLNLSFFREIGEDLAKDHKVSYFELTEDRTVNSIQLGALCEAAHVIFIEFAQTPIEYVLSMFPEKKIVVRIHRIEIYQPIYGLNWNAVDLAIFSAEHVRQRFYEKLRDANKQRGAVVNEPISLMVIPTNVYDPKAFKFVERAYEKPYRICVVGNIVPKKRVYTLVQMFAELGEDFTLDILGSPMTSGYGNPEYLDNIKDLIAILGLENSVRILSRVPRDEMARFFEEHDIIVSNSNEEGSCVNLAEAMATGCYPLINHWRGAPEIYGERYVYDTISQFMLKLMEWSGKTREEKLRLSRDASDSVKHLDAWKHARRIRRLVEKVYESDKIAVFYDHILPYMVAQRDNPRLRSLKRFVEDWVQPRDRILELGCGIGVLSRHMSRLGAKVTAVDVSLKSIEYARKHSRGVRYLTGDALTMDLQEKFDLVIICDFIEHVRLADNERLIAKLTDLAPTLLFSFPLPETPRGGLLTQPIDELVQPERLMETLGRHGFTHIRHKEQVDGYYRLVVAKAA